MQISKINLNDNSDLNFIKDFLSPYTKRAYLVGGSVRDLLLGQQIYDYDIELYDISENDFGSLMQKLGANGFGKSFFVYKFKNFDFALARTENKVKAGHTGFETKICNDEKLASKRRDFTINSMMINLFSGEFLDFHQGLKDLKNGLLRHIDEKSFKEDSLRILRGIAFASRFNFKIANESLKLMQSMDIMELSKDRINAELYKFFVSSRLDIGYKYLQILNLEEKIFHFNSLKFSEQFQNLLKNAREFVKDEALFLYLYLNFFKLDFDIFFQKTKLKKAFLRSAKQPFFLDKISDFELGLIAFEMPLKNQLRHSAC